jgi:hypothetical protein
MLGVPRSRVNPGERLIRRATRRTMGTVRSFWFAIVRSAIST